MSYFLYLAIAHCIISPLVDGPVKFMHNLVDKTVVLIETELLYRRTPDEMWITVEDNESKILLDIFYVENEEWEKIENNGKFFSEYGREGSKTNFFFTSSDGKYYLYELNGEFTKKIPTYEYAIKTAIYEGRPQDPRITSQTDTLITELAKHVEQANDTIKLIRDVQKLDSLNDVTYKSLISSIRFIVIWTFLIKIVVFFSMSYFFNKNLLGFFHGRKIVPK